MTASPLAKEDAMESEPRHTPEPWEWGPFGRLMAPGYIEVLTAVEYACDGLPSIEWENNADAALIAKAPAMAAELARLERILSQKGYRKSCDIPACNCGDSWAHGGNAETRLQEFHQALVDADVETQGKTLLTATKDALAELARLREVNAALVSALQGVIRVADRKTDEFDAARSALAAAVQK